MPSPAPTTTIVAATVGTETPTMHPTVTSTTGAKAGESFTVASVESDDSSSGKGGKGGPAPNGKGGKGVTAPPTTAPSSSPIGDSSSLAPTDGKGKGGKGRSEAIASVEVIALNVKSSSATNGKGGKGSTLAPTTTPSSSPIGDSSFTPTSGKGKGGKGSSEAIASSSIGKDGKGSTSAPTTAPSSSIGDSSSPAPTSGKGKGGKGGSESVSSAEVVVSATTGKGGKGSTLSPTAAPSSSSSPIGDSSLAPTPGKGGSSKGKNGRNLHVGPHAPLDMSIQSAVPGPVESTAVPTNSPQGGDSPSSSPVQAASSMVVVGDQVETATVSPTKSPSSGKGKILKTLQKAAGVIVDGFTGTSEKMLPTALPTTIPSALPFTAAPTTAQPSDSPTSQQPAVPAGDTVSNDPLVGTLDHDATASPVDTPSVAPTQQQQQQQDGSIPKGKIVEVAEKVVAAVKDRFGTQPSMAPTFATLEPVAGAASQNSGGIRNRSPKGKADRKLHAHKPAGVDMVPPPVPVVHQSPTATPTSLITADALDTLPDASGKGTKNAKGVTAVLKGAVDRLSGKGERGRRRHARH